MLGASNDYGIVNFFDGRPSTDPVIQFSTVRNCADTQPKAQSRPWHIITELFTRPSVRDNKDGIAWIPATFGGLRNEKGNLRHGANVLSIHGIMLDLDGKGQTYTTDELRACFSGFQYLAHTTYRHTPENPRWRVFLPTASPLHPTQLKNAIRKVAAAFNLDIDTSCVDASHLYFMPSVPMDRAYHYQLIHDIGRLLDVDDLPNLSLRDEDVDKTIAVQTPNEPSNKYLLLGSYVDNVTTLITKEKITSWSRNEAICAAVAQSMGFCVDGLLENRRIGGIRSPLPGHTDNHPSCGLIVSNGAVLFKDFSGHFGRETYNLPTLAATIAYQELHEMNPPENALWWLRLLYEAGLIRMADVEIPALPDDATEGVRKVYDGFKLLLGLKWRYKGGQRSTAFARRFVAAWCGVSEATAHRAKIYLMEQGIISMVGTQGKGHSECGVFLPGKIRKRKPKKTSPEPRRATESHKPDKQTRLHIALAADRLKADYEGMAIEPDEMITALAEYSGIPEIALRHYSDLLHSIVRDFKKGRR